ncbi:heme o synthase [Salinispora tropica]|uniref:Protoheme IX farnesyltransferase n=1 Tax=Salinispora tropica (strain ATCC BAA-916 / DSM 44818 / JCM 13857 / NBRC 105044 / CNB-440) TaxID=369723 RepID=COXX_SALTO|nr:heme o synthase [Salinispora tropica]A4X9F8.2 RecName: Full=Protoheme IX farnesyltransferase; AltName: Full=Heme B farnesyltransferase; AltName: Full=Heme O synthase [Salinispora tropica CNB-440]
MSMITERPVSDPAGQSVSATGDGAVGSRRDMRAVVAAYVALTKPRIVELLLVTTVPAMMLAHGGLPSLWLMAVVLVGGSLAAGAASVLNCYIDRDIDQVMRRTKRRPLPAHTVAPRNALIFGLVLATVSVTLLAVFTNALAAGLTLAAILYYDLVYTAWLKRTTTANTFWGGACGAAPVLIGWAAVTGSLAPAAWALFGVVFFWQMPHFYPLAMKYKDDYARAGIPMLPVVASTRRVNAEILVFAWLTVLVSLVTWPLGAGMGPIYGLPTLVVGVIFLVEAHRLCRRAARGEAVKPMRLFHWSTTYLTVVFAAVALDALI